MHALLRRGVLHAQSAQFYSRPQYLAHLLDAHLSTSKRHRGSPPPIKESHVPCKTMGYLSLGWCYSYLEQK